MNTRFSARNLICFSLLLAGSCTTHREPSAAIRIRWAHDPETLSPFDLHNQAAVDANNLLHMSLLQGQTQPLAIGPALAATLPVMARRGDSLTTFRYTIRPAATWDDGRPVLATDVAFTLRLMSCPGLPNEAVRTNISLIRELELDPTNPRAFTLVCAGQSPDLLLLSSDFFVLSEASLDPQHRLRRYALPRLQRWPATLPADTALQALARSYQAADLANHPERSPGCGPYRLARWEKDRALSFRRKTGWWGQHEPDLPLAQQARAAQLDYLVLPDAGAATLALRRGDIDVFPQFPAAEFQRLSTNPAPEVRLYTSNSVDLALAGFNTQRPALADALTRQALSRLFDTAGLLQGTQQGKGQRTASLVTPSDRASYNDSLRPIPYDPAGARVLLQRAGWQQRPTGWQRPGAQGPQHLRLVVRYRATDALFATTALQFRAAAVALGIGIELRPTEPTLFNKALEEGDFDLYMRTMHGSPFNTNFAQLLHSASPSTTNTTRFSNPACDRLIETVATIRDSLARARQLRRLQALLQQQAPLVPLFFLPNRVAARSDCRGLYVNSLKPGFIAPTIERVAASR